MCGICGKLNFDLQQPVPAALLKAMAQQIEHRGPDDEGYYRAANIGLGFRRLSIIDLSTGHQPISNEDGTVWIIFNGEIYNYRELRQELLSKGHIFSSGTDTEVIVHLYEEMGDRCVEKLRGMFAFAIWDNRNRSLLLARDRVGIKPLYYSLSNKGISFGSEIKSLLADPDTGRTLNVQVIDRFLTFQYVPGRETMFQDIHKLQPGHYLKVHGNKVEIKKYWDLDFSPVPKNLSSAEEELAGLLEETVRLHMISDVPVGFLLSGGVDSTGLLGIAASADGPEFSSFTVGFSGGVTDERPYAKLAADRFHTRHHEITFSAKDFEAALPKYVWHMEEPVCEPPAIALYYVSKLARSHVKVLISGEGGDEAFGGYPNYRNILWLERLKRMLGPLRMPVSQIANAAQGMLPRSTRKYAPLLDIPFPNYYFGRTAYNPASPDLYSDYFRERLNRNFSLEPACDCHKTANTHGIVNRMLYVDTKTWLPDDLLVKADKITMANSVELRVPLLDHKVLEFAASLPDNFKVRGFKTKYIAKRVLGQHVPREIIARKKAGFPVPYSSWLRAEMKEWLQSILLDPSTLRRGYFVPGRIERLIKENGEAGQHSKTLFSLSVLELWHRAFAENRAASPATLSERSTHPVGSISE